MKINGAEKLISKMIDREYAEMADLPEDQLYEEFLDDDDALVDEKKDEYYYANRIAKGYGLTDNKI
jgi:hypothetical protein